MVKHKTGGGAGTNQYAVKGTAKTVLPTRKGGLPGALVVQKGRYASRSDQPSAAPPIPMSATTGITFDPSDPNCPPELLLEMADDPAYQQEVALNPNSPPEALQIVFDTIDHNQRHVVCDNPNCPPAVLAALAVDDNRIIRSTVAGDGRIPDDLIRQLANDLSGAVRRSVSKRVRCPQDVLDQLTADPKAYVREAIAARTDHTPQRWTTLASDKELYVRLTVANNSSCPPEIQERLAKDKTGQVREWIADRPDNPPARMATLAADKQPTVRKAVAKNPHCPADVLGILAVDINRAVRDAVLTNPSRPIAIPPNTPDQPLTKATLLSIAQNPNTTVDQLHEIIALRSPDQDLADLIFRHPNVSVPDQVGLFGTVRTLYRWQSLNRPDCPPEILALGALWNETNTREIALQHPNCPPEPLAEWAGRSGKSACLALQHPNCPLNALIKVIEKGPMKLRQVALANPNTPAHLRAVGILGTS